MLEMAHNKLKFSVQLRKHEQNNIPKDLENPMEFSKKSKMASWIFWCPKWPRQCRPTMALGSLWPKSLTLPASRGHIDLVRKMLIGNQLPLLVISRLLYPLPVI